MRGALASFAVLASSVYAASVAELVAELRAAPTQSDRIRTLEDSQVHRIRRISPPFILINLE